jgi:molybdenum cofactor cytidylyltransferase
MPERRVGIIVLAAGASVRMRMPKQLVKIGGVTMIRRAAENAIESNCRPIIMVLGANAEMLQPELKGLEITIALNPDWP